MNLAPRPADTLPAIDPRTRALALAVRQALLMMVDALEVYLNMPRTSDLRKSQR